MPSDRCFHTFFSRPSSPATIPVQSCGALLLKIAGYVWVLRCASIHTPHVYATQQFKIKLCSRSSENCVHSFTHIFNSVLKTEEKKKVIARATQAVLCVCFRHSVWLMGVNDVRLRVLFNQMLKKVMRKPCGTHMSLSLPLAHSYTLAAKWALFMELA